MAVDDELPHTATDLRKLMHEKTLCAHCPQGLFEAVTITGYTAIQARIQAIMTPIENLNGLHICVFCTAKGRYIPTHMALCEGYEQATTEQNA